MITDLTGFAAGIGAAISADGLVLVFITAAAIWGVGVRVYVAGHSVLKGIK